MQSAADNSRSLPDLTVQKPKKSRRAGTSVLHSRGTSGMASMSELCPKCLHPLSDETDLANDRSGVFEALTETCNAIDVLLSASQGASEVLRSEVEARMRLACLNKGNRHERRPRSS